MRFRLLGFLGFLTACGGAPIPDLTAWDSEVSGLRTRVSDYQAQAPSTPAQTSCDQALNSYRMDMEPMLRRMRAMSGGMDGCMSAMGHLGEADLSRTCDDMDAELARYASEGCHSSDPAKNQADAEAHAVRMLGYLDLSAQRSHSLSGMMGAGMMSTGMMGGGMCR